MEHVVLLKAVVQTRTLHTINTYHELLNIDLFHWTTFFFFSFFNAQRAWTTTYNSFKRLLPQQ